MQQQNKGISKANENLQEIKANVQDITEANSPSEFLSFLNDVLEQIHESKEEVIHNKHFAIVRIIEDVVQPWFRNDTNEIASGIWELLDTFGPEDMKEVMGAVLTVLGKELFEDALSEVAFNANIKGIKTLAIICNATAILHKELLAKKVLGGTSKKKLEIANAATL